MTLRMVKSEAQARNPHRFSHDASTILLGEAKA